MTKTRNYQLDNVKAVLIFLVVVGHFADFYVSVSTNMKFLYFYIYIFHMPLFIFLSGYFIKSTVNSKRFKVERVLSYFLLYLLFKVAMFVLFKYGFSNPDIKFNTFNESDVPWYLLAMSVWISLTYILKQIKPTVLLPISFLIGIFVGYDSFVGDYLVLSRIIVFFPFFLLGYYMTNTQLAKLLSIKNLKIIAAFVLIAAFLIIYFNIDSVYQFRGFLTARNSYEALNQPVYGGFYRLFFYLLSIVMSLSVLLVVPSFKNLFTVIGQRTLQVYILHMPLLYIFHHLDLSNFLVMVSEYNWLKLYILLSIPVTLLLAARPLEWPFKKIMGLNYNKMFY